MNKAGTIEQYIERANFSRTIRNVLRSADIQPAVPNAGEIDG